MRQFSVQGVARGGQVVLDVPLDLPDGIVVIVTDGARNEEEWRVKQLTALKRLDLLDDPDWEARVKDERKTTLEELWREMERLEATRSKLPQSERNQSTPSRP
jgi:hypothetical protein